MHLNPYGEYAVQLAVDLANCPPETTRELVERCRAAGIVIDFAVTDDDLSQALGMLAEWSLIADNADPETRAKHVNAMLEEASAYPRMTNHVGDGWHLHYRDDQQSLSGVLKALVSVGTALHLVGRGMHRLGRCAVADCANLYADFSRNGRQRYCSPRCANRDAVRRHRAQ